jgi:alpha-mannosidase
MALTIEWKNRISRWQKVLWNIIYRPLGAVEFSGFTTKKHLSWEEAFHSNFTPKPLGTKWGAKWEYGWFKTSLVIPSEAAKQRVVIIFDTGGQESLVWINKKPKGSFGWGHKEITLSTNAQAGDVYEILMESYAGHGQITVGEGPYPYGVESMPEPSSAQAEIKESTFGIWREDIYQAAVDFTTLIELREHLDPLSLRASEIDEALMETTMIIDPELAGDELLRSVLAGRQRLRSLLSKKNGPTMPTLFAFGHAHIDIAWLWPLQQTKRKMAMTVLNQLLLFDEYPKYKFLQSQPQLMWMLRENYPEIYEYLKNAIHKGQVIPDGGMWVEADTNLTGGESLIRQLLYGNQFFREELDVKSEILWLPDVFGYSGALPQILIGCGMKGFATQKISWAYNGGEKFPYNTFLWEGIDGTAIPAHIFSEYNSELRPSSISDRWNSRLQLNGIKSMILAFGWGDGGGGPTRDHLEYYQRVKDLEGLPKVKMASPEEFFRDLEDQGLPKERYVGELYFQAHRGTYTSQAKTKLGNRKSEVALREAEFWGSIARLVGDYRFTPKTLWPAWQNILLNQFHDILPGSSIHRVYEEAETLYDQTRQIAGHITNEAIHKIVKPGNIPIVFNSLSWQRRVIVETDTGLREVEVPPCGWSVITSKNILTEREGGFSTATLDVDGFVIENESLRATFDHQARLISLWDYETNQERMSGPGNQLNLFKDVPTKWDAWDIDSMVESQPVETPEKADILIIGDSPLVARVLITRHLHDSIVRQEISLCRGSRRIDFDTHINWQERHKLLKVSFPFDIHTSKMISEIQFGYISRPNHQSRQFDQDRYEVCNHKWSALAEVDRGVAVLNDSKYGLSVRGHTINLTLLKSSLAPDMTADLGEQHFVYSVYTWNGSLLESRLVHEAYELNYPEVVVEGEVVEPQHSYMSLDASNIIIESVKLAEDGSNDLIIRMYESIRTKTTTYLQVNLPIIQAIETNLIEQKEKTLIITNNRIELVFRPFEIKTLRLIFESIQ